MLRGFIFRKYLLNTETSLGSVFLLYSHSVVAITCTFPSSAVGNSMYTCSASPVVPREPPPTSHPPSPTHRLALCKGQYPDFLLDSWDSYDHKHRSENDRPGMCVYVCVCVCVCVYVCVCVCMYMCV